MKANQRKILADRKRKLRERLAQKAFKAQSEPMLEGVNLDYEISGRTSAIGTGGIGAFHKMVERLGLVEALNDGVKVFKRHLPYFESDHILSLCYNVLSGGTCLEDIELLRQDEAYLDALFVDRIPDPTTAGDFLRRFDGPCVLSLMDVINQTRVKVWQAESDKLGKRAVLDVDGTICPTDAQCKQGVDISYNGVWGYAPLIVSLSNTKEVLYLVNRPGNAPSHLGAAAYIDQAIDLVCPYFEEVFVRGDTDFSLTENFDRWDARCRFVFGINAMPNLVEVAKGLSQGAFAPLLRKPKYTVQTTPRKKPAKVKPKIVKTRNFKTIHLMTEEVAEFTYRPGKCKKTYRIVVLKKHLKITQGQDVLGFETRYLFYITNDWQMTPQQIVFFSNARCDQENTIEQLKNGIKALRMPAKALVSNWAYMVCATLAWNLKAWYGLLCPDPILSKQILRMEFRRFLNAFIRIPCQIIKTGRRIIYRILNYTAYTKTFIKTFLHIKNFRFT